MCEKKVRKYLEVLDGWEIEFRSVFGVEVYNVYLWVLWESRVGWGGGNSKSIEEKERKKKK